MEQEETQSEKNSSKTLNYSKMTPEEFNALSPEEKDKAATELLMLATEGFLKDKTTLRIKRQHD